MDPDSKKFNFPSYISFFLSILGLYFLHLTTIKVNNQFLFIGFGLILVGFIVGIISLGGIKQSSKKFSEVTKDDVSGIGGILYILKSMFFFEDINGRKGEGWAVASISIFLVVTIGVIIALISSI